MAEARLGPLRPAPPLARRGVFDDMPESSPELTAVSDLTNVVVWELEVPGPGVLGHAPCRRLLKPPAAGGPYRVPPGPAGRSVTGDELGDAVLAPIVETVKAGVTWETYELIQELEAPDGVGH